MEIAFLSVPCFYKKTILFCITLWRFLASLLSVMVLNLTFLNQIEQMKSKVLAIFLLKMGVKMEFLFISLKQFLSLPVDSVNRSICIHGWHEKHAFGRLNTRKILIKILGILFDQPRKSHLSFPDFLNIDLLVSKTTKISQNLPWQGKQISIST